MVPFLLCVRWREGGTWQGLCSPMYEKGEAGTLSLSKQKAVTAGREELVPCSSQGEGAGQGAWIGSCGGTD